MPTWHEAQSSSWSLRCKDFCLKLQFRVDRLLSKPRCFVLGCCYLYSGVVCALRVVSFESDFILSMELFSARLSAGATHGIFELIRTRIPYTDSLGTLTARFSQNVFEQIRQIVKVAGIVNVFSCDFLQLAFEIFICTNSNGSNVDFFFLWREGTGKYEPLGRPEFQWRMEISRDSLGYRVVLYSISFFIIWNKRHIECGG